METKINCKVYGVPGLPRLMFKKKSIKKKIKQANSAANGQK